MNPFAPHERLQSRSTPVNSPGLGLEWGPPRGSAAIGAFQSEDLSEDIGNIKEETKLDDLQQTGITADHGRDLSRWLYPRQQFLNQTPPI
jgi:hypothetical protein